VVPGTLLEEEGGSVEISVDLLIALFRAAPEEDAEKEENENPGGRGR
jgi:hypothetical protein